MHCVQKPFPDIFCWILPLLSLLNIRDQRAIVLSVIRLTVVFIKNPRPKSHCIVCCLIYGETKAPLYCLLFDLLLSLLNIRDQRAIVLSVVRYTVVFIKYSRPNSHCIVCCLIYDETKEPLYCLLFDLRWDQRAIVLSVVWFTVRQKSHCIVCCLIYGETKEPLYCLLFDLRSDYDFGIFKLFFLATEQ